MRVSHVSYYFHHQPAATKHMLSLFRTGHAERGGRKMDFVVHGVFPVSTGDNNSFKRGRDP